MAPGPRTDRTRTDLVPPEAERRPVRLEAHGDVRVDDWFWLRDKDDPAVIDHLKAENAYTEAEMAGTDDLQAELFAEMVARIEETDLSVPVRKGPWLYYSRTVEGSSYAIHCRRPAGPGGRAEPAPGSVGSGETGPSRPSGPPADEQVILDENQQAEGHEYFAVGALSVSPDHGWLAYSTDTTGGERFTMRFTELATGAVSPESLTDTSYGVAWANDNATVFYVRVDEAMRPHQLWRHRVGERPRRGRPGLRGARRPLLPRGGPDQGRAVRADEPGLQGDLRGPGTARRRPTRRVHGHRAPAPGHRVQRGPRPGPTPARGGRAGSSSSPTTGPRTSG